MSVTRRVEVEIGNPASVSGHLRLEVLSNENIRVWASHGKGEARVATSFFFDSREEAVEFFSQCLEAVE